jgi:hypothetical protein
LGKVDADFLTKLEELISTSRPEERKVNAILKTSLVAVLMINYFYLSCPKGDVHTFELKPKSGVREPAPSSILEKRKADIEKIQDKEIKEMLLTKGCEYKLLPMDKVIKGQPFSAHDTTKIFTDTNATIKKMGKEPMNFLKYFVNGKKQKDMPDDAIDVLSDILQADKPLEAMQKLQSSAVCSAEAALKAFANIPASNIEKHLEAAFSNLVKGNFDSTVEGSIASVLSYLVSRCARDGSIMVSFAEAGDGELSIGEKRAVFNGKNYVYRVGVIDLDAKYIEKLPKYLTMKEEYYNNLIDQLI